MRLPLLMALLFLVLAFSSSAHSGAPAGTDRQLALLQTTPVVEFRETTRTVSEGSGSVTLTVQVVGTLTTSATVQYFTQDGTARAGIDYVSQTGTLSFGPTQLTRTITIEIRDDNVAEETETFVVVLHNPVGVVLDPDRQTAVVVILDDDAVTTPTPIFVDAYEPNNTLQEAYTMSPDGPPLSNITLWPVGDVDWFRFNVKRGLAYEVLTRDLDAGLDTVLTLFNTSGNQVATNDDYEVGNRASRIVFTAAAEGFYYARITNKSPTDPTNLTYRFDVNEIQPPPSPTPAPTGTRVPGADACEYNGSFETACLIGPGQTYDLNFVPLFGEGPDNDFFRMWIKPGITYTCETLDLSSVTDTNMILYDHNRNGIAGNDDRATGDLSSSVTYHSTYTGWLYVLVGPHVVASYEDSFLYTYSLRCTESVAPTATATSPPSQFTGAVVTRPPTPTAMVAPVGTEEADMEAIETPTATPTPLVRIVPLPTSTPAVPARAAINLNLTIYYDENRDFTPSLTEGVEDVAVAVYDNATNELLAFGYTNEAGTIRFGPLEVSGSVRLSVPYLRYTQTFAGDSNVFIRVAPPVTGP
jgi:hypothetical protein